MTPKNRITAVLLVNLGSPEAPTRSAVRRYLKEFLSDPRVIGIPKFIWWFILRLVVLPFRPKRSAALYKKVWTEQGSPLVATTTAQAAALENDLKDRNIKVIAAMRYGKPSIADAFTVLQTYHVDELVVLPLYPQYSQTTTASTFDAVSKALQKWIWIPKLHFINHYADHPDYISALAESILAYWQQHGKPEKLALSYHGLPIQSLDKGDPYYCHCRKTSRLLIEKLNLSEEEVAVCFQSRFGPAKWLQPYTSDILTAWAQQGVKHVGVVCPGFAADCLETLEEINMQYREVFMKAGGQRYDYIPALNTDSNHIKLLSNLLRSTLVTSESKSQ